jgi:prepilin-type N-terminal cleavage/methylation domain-containing protein
MKGFTLIELLMVVSILLIFTAIYLPNLKKGDELFALQRAANKLAQDLRIASEMAMAGKLIGSQFPKGGYGIYFPSTNSDQYYLFADSNGDSFYTTTTDSIVENLSLQEKGVTIQSILPPPPVSIVFFPPDPTVTIKNNSGTSSQATITLFQNGKTMGVRVNKVGLIEIYNP